jgi:hypothetical protein
VSALDPRDVEAIARAFVAGTLPKERWRHDAHCVAAAWLIAQHPDVDWTREFGRLVRRYNESVGTPNTDTSGYHETLTLFYVREIKRFLSARAGRPFDDVIVELLASPVAEVRYPLGFWSRERLFSVEARRTWVEPDLRPLDGVS